MSPRSFGIEGTTDEDRADRGSRFSEVCEALFANPYQRTWGAEGEPPLPNLVLMVAPNSPWRLISLDRAGNRRAITLEPSGTYDGLAK